MTIFKIEIFLEEVFRQFGTDLVTNAINLGDYFIAGSYEILTKLMLTLKINVKQSQSLAELLNKLSKDNR